ncbi:hypothetical protein [Terrimonas sp.]|uniref:hypothetical protein n=1 Tax=Terrimonas sp. TaxID=1914338 RepID=UPI000E32748C|nr:hypothetical protein [Terrimonas sp.]
MAKSKSSYSNYRIKQFSSFEEMDEDKAKQMAVILPVEHLKNTTKLIKNIYDEKLKQPMSKRIKFKK